MSRSFGATLILQNIKVASKPYDIFLTTFFKKMFFDVQTILMHQKRKFTDYFLRKMQFNARNRVHLRACQVAMTTKMSVRVQELISFEPP